MISDDTTYLARHHSTLASWLVQQLGRALVVGMLTSGVAIVILFLAGDGDPDSATGWISLILGLLAFGIYLSSGDAPMPPAAPMSRLDVDPDGRSRP